MQTIDLHISMLCLSSDYFPIILRLLSFRRVSVHFCDMPIHVLLQSGPNHTRKLSNQYQGHQALE